MVDGAIDRIERVNPELNAVIIPLFEQARAEAAGDLPDGPFRGVPFLFKDLSGVRAGDPYHMGNLGLKELDHHATVTTSFARRIVDAGFVTVGKTNTPELGSLPTTEPVAYGPTHNPWNPEHSPGGSSGGSAASVAAGLVPVASAGDGGGSIRIPAAACGLVGLKPSRGRVSTAPAGEVWAGAAIELVVSRSVRDTAALLDVAAGPELGDRYAMLAPASPYLDLVGADPGSLRVGLTPGLDGVPIDAEVAEAVTSTGQLLEQLGHRVDVDQPAALAEGDPDRNFSRVLAAATALDFDHLAEIIGRPLTENDVESTNWWFAEYGRKLSATEYLHAREWWDNLGLRMAQWWAAGHDILVTPTLTRTATPLGWFDDRVTSGDRIRSLIPYTWPFNVTGQPAISVPLHHSSDGFPIGVQLVAAPGREDLLIQLAAQLEQAQPWGGRRPPIHA
ncbi:MAG: amidase [Actinomycetia bacterium]|nr:amidase [Actinomycetes bacterium]